MPRLKCAVGWPISLRMIVLVLWVSALCAGSAAAEDQLKVVDFAGTDVGKVDLAGKIVKFIPTTELPSLPIRVLDISKKGHPLIKSKSGEDLWIDRMDITLSQSGSVKVLCEALLVGGASDRKVLATRALGSACE